MFIVILVVVLWLSALVMLGIGKIKYDYGKSTLSLRPWSLVPLALGFIILFIGSINIVPPGHVGVPVAFGKAHEAVDPGFHLLAPWTVVKSINTQVQNYTMSGSTTEGAQAGNDSVPVNTKDQVSVAVDSTVLYRLTVGQAKNVFVNIGTDYVNQVVRPTIRSAIRDAAVQYDAIDLATDDRAAFQAAAQAQIESNLGKDGIEVVDLQIRDMVLPASLQTSINAKAAAQQDVARQAFVLQSTQQQADQRVVQAKGIRDAEDIIRQTLTPQYLEYEYIQTLQNLAASKNTTYLFLPNDPANLPNFQLPLNQK